VPAATAVAAARTAAANLLDMSGPFEAQPCTWSHG
jgi:hypothetical protein